ncbi:hypothetical protein HUU53_05010 [Candidatus Micrarchaeota archaeon]|nr:hypothetical protein [Candidatus Micrarchaeota archaeon]
MLEWIIGSCIITAGLTIYSTPYFMRFFRNIGVTAIDQQKTTKPVLPTSGGMPVAYSFFFGLLIFVALNTFIIKDPSINLASIMAELI